MADCGVVGIPDERAGELPKAYIVKKPGLLFIYYIFLPHIGGAR